jgi:hypothetical protein
MNLEELLIANQIVRYVIDAEQLAENDSRQTFHAENAARHRV